MTEQLLWLSYCSLLRCTCWTLCTNIPLLSSHIKKTEWYAEQLTMCQFLKLLCQVFHGHLVFGLILELTKLPQYFTAAQSAHHRLSCLLGTTETCQVLKVAALWPQ